VTDSSEITRDEPVQPDDDPDVLYSVKHLTVEYNTRAGPVTAVDNIFLDVRKGEVLGLVGESGCGKSTLGKAMMRMIKTPGRILHGELRFDGTDLMALSERRMRKVRGARIAMVFQDPMTSLNPLLTIEDHIVQAIRCHEPGVSQKEAVARARELVERLGIREERIEDYPHQFSGGMRQRIMIALALASKADLVIADEPTTALDVIVEAQFLDLLRELRDELGLTIVLITHNIGVIAEFADRVAVMYAGRLAEVTDVGSLFANPLHPYSEGLLKAVPNIALSETDLYQMSGAPPSLVNLPVGCPFHPRCPQKMEVCEREPALIEVRPDHQCACWLHEGASDANG
jgi:peptide/nickel transport system ATP-binding protein